MPTASEKLRMQAVQRDAQSADPPKLDAVFQEFLSTRTKSFPEAVREIEAQIREVVNDPNLAAKFVTGPAREAAANDSYYTGLMAAITGVAKRGFPTASERGRYFITSVKHLDAKHGIGRSPGPQPGTDPRKERDGTGADEIPLP